MNSLSWLGKNQTRKANIKNAIKAMQGWQQQHRKAEANLLQHGFLLQHFLHSLAAINSRQKNDTTNN